MADPREAAHALVSAAKSGNALARAAIDRALAAADAGDATAARVVEALDDAQREQALATFVARYVHGAGVGGAPRNTGALTRVGEVRVEGDPCCPPCGKGAR